MVLWIEGRDSAGWEIEAGGPTVGLDGIEGVSGIYSSPNSSEYDEEASFKVIDVRMTPKRLEIRQN